MCVCLFQLFLKQEKSIRKVTETLSIYETYVPAKLFSICSENEFIMWPGCLSQSSGGRKREKKIRSQGKGKGEPPHNRSAYFLLSVPFMASFHRLPKCNGTDFCPCIPTEPTAMSTCTSKICSPILKSKGKFHKVTEAARGTSIIKQFTLKAACNLSSMSFSGLTPLVVHYSSKESKERQFSLTESPV